MKRIIKLTTLALIILQVFMCSSPSFALVTEIGDTPLIYVKKKIEGITMSYYGQEIIPYYTVYEKDGVEYPAYCVDYFHGGVTDNKSYNVEVTEEYVNENTTDSKRLGVWRAIINGHPFISYEDLGCKDEYEAYAATKQAVFFMLYEDRDLKWYTYEGEEGTRVYNAMLKIIEAAKSSTKIPQSTSINLTQTDWKVDEINNKYLSKEITLNCEARIYAFIVTTEKNAPEGTMITDLDNNELEIFHQCNKFKILVPLDKLISNDTFEINIIGNVVSYPMYFGEANNSNLQDYVLTEGFLKQRLLGSIIEYPENKTKLKIEKTDETGKHLVGVKFNILDENKNIIYKNLETNDNGIIYINNIIPGKYFIQETETLEEYEYNNELIELTIDLNEEKEIIIQNNKVPKEPTIPEVVIPELPKLPRTGW